jgi:uncharacterized membrane protein
MINAAFRDGRRIEALDVLRGFVMILMTLDHSSAAFNAGRTMSDSAVVFPSSTALDPVQFAVRWITHLCAPSFVFLAGAGLALSVVRRQRAGQSAGAIDRDIALRGLLLVVLDVVWMSWTPRLDLSVIEVGVLSAIGAAMLTMVVVRRLPPSIVLVMGIAIIVGGEAIITRLDPNDALAAETLTSGYIGRVLYLYPVIPWMGILFVGWALGHRIAGPGMRSREWLMLALGAALVFAVVRGANAYGNEHLLRQSGSWIEVLHVSKYPPSLAYVALELAIAFALLAMFWRWKMPWTPMVVLGQTALFYYLIHVHLFKVTAAALGMFKNRGLGTVLVAWLAMLVVLYPLCLAYLGLKRRYPRSVLRLI